MLRNTFEGLAHETTWFITVDVVPHSRIQGPHFTTMFLDKFKFLFVSCQIISFKSSRTMVLHLLPYVAEEMGQERWPQKESKKFHVPSPTEFLGQLLRKSDKLGNFGYCLCLLSTLYVHWGLVHLVPSYCKETVSCPTTTKARAHWLCSILSTSQRPAAAQMTSPGLKHSFLNQLKWKWWFCTCANFRV